jgi:phosphatidylinositol alpha-1,6-mannosyltransferase
MASQLRNGGASNIVALSHGHEVWWAKIPILKQMLQKIIKDVDKLGYLGTFTKNQISKATTEVNKLVQIAPGIDTNYFQPKTANPSLIAKYQLESRRVIVCVARLVHRKGQDQLIKALPDILEKFPEAILLIVGQGPIEQMLRNSARQLGVTHKVIFTGRVPHADLSDYISLGEVFAMPVRSRFYGFEVEGLGIAYLEASACGLPVVVGNSGGAVDAVIDQVTGLLVDGKNINEISGAICRLLAEPAKAQAMGQAGRGWVISDWQLSSWSEKFNNLLIRN